MLFIAGTSSRAQQYFSDNFESYTAGAYVAPQSNQWTTWSAALGYGSEGGADDVYVNNSLAYSGSKSLYFYSASGNGPHDLVLDFGGVHSSGKFKYKAMYYIPTGGYSYFNFQGGAGVGQQWAMDFYFYSGGTWNAYGGGSTNGTFPHNQWFELAIDVNFDTDTWDIYINGTLQGTLNNTASISYLDLYEVYSGSEWYMDDVSFCVNQACNPELELTNLQINPASLCTHHEGDLSVSVKNNSTFSAEGMTLGLDVGGVTSSYAVNLNSLAPGASTTVNLTGVVVPANAGSITVAAINIQGDINAANDTAKTTITVLPSPTGTQIVKSTPYESPRMQSAGTLADPDVVTGGDVLTYEVVPPVGKNNSGYGSTWNITGLTFFTINGTTLASSYYAFTAPTGGNNAKITFSPDAALLDSAVIYSFAVNDMGNTCDSVLRRYINVVPVPVASFTHLDVCDKQTMSFTNTTTLQSGSMSFTWDFGDGTSSTLQNPTKLYATYGAYTVKLVVTSNWGYMDSIDVVVNVNQLPTADFGVTNACEGSDVQFADQSLLPIGTPSYDWDFGDGSSHGTGPSTGHQYAVPGTYSITMTVTINGCPDSKTKYGTQAPRAVPSFTSQTACNNATAKFTNGSNLLFGNFGSTWRFGDGSIATSYHASHKYSGFGSFDVTLITSTDLGCIDSVTQTVTLIESPNADFSLSNACSEEWITINNLTNTPGSGANTYSWNLGNGMTSTDEHPITQYTGPGTYTIKLVAFNGNGCVDSIERTLLIDTKPIADFIANDVCEGEESTFTNNTVNLPNGGSNNWDFGNGQTSTSTDASFTYAASGQYAVSLVVSTVNGCSDTATQLISVNPLPDATFVVASGEKGDGTMTFTANAAVSNSFLWFLGDGSKPTGQIEIHTYKAPGNYEVKLIVTSPAGCKNESTQTVSVTPSGLGDDLNNAMKVYPNPNTGVFTVKLSDEAINPALEVFNAQGQSVLLMPNVSLDNGSVQVDLSAVVPGVYFVRLTSNGQSWNQKIQIH